MELLKQGDFVIVYDLNNHDLERGIIIQDEKDNNPIYVAIVRKGIICQNYHNREFVVKVS